VDFSPEGSNAHCKHWRAGADELPRRAQIDTPATEVDPLNPRQIAIFNP
jgi:hypothetical protein